MPRWEPKVFPSISKYNWYHLARFLLLLYEFLMGEIVNTEYVTPYYSYISNGEKILEYLSIIRTYKRYCLQFHEKSAEYWGYVRLPDTVVVFSNAVVTLPRNNDKTNRRATTRFTLAYILYRAFNRPSLNNQSRRRRIGTAQQLSFDTLLYELVLVRGARTTAVRTIRPISLAPFMSRNGAGCISVSLTLITYLAKSSNSREAAAWWRASSPKMATLDQWNASNRSENTNWQVRGEHCGSIAV